MDDKPHPYAQIAATTQAIEALLTACPDECLDSMLEGLTHYIQARWALLDAKRVMRGEEPYNAAYWNHLELVELVPTLAPNASDSPCREPVPAVPDSAIETPGNVRNVSEDSPKRPKP